MLKNKIKLKHKYKLVLFVLEPIILNLKLITQTWKY